MHLGGRHVIVNVTPPCRSSRGFAGACFHTQLLILIGVHMCIEVPRDMAETELGGAKLMQGKAYF